MPEICRGKTFEDTVRANKSKPEKKTEPTKKIFGNNLGIPKQTLVKIGLMLQEADEIVIGGTTTYESNVDYTWLNIICQVMNRSWRKENPIKIVVKKNA